MICIVKVTMVNVAARLTLPDVYRSILIVLKQFGDVSRFRLQPQIAAVYGAAFSVLLVSSKIS